MRLIRAVLLATALMLLAAPAAVADPTPTPTVPTAPLPIELVVHPDSDVLGQPGLQVAAGMSKPPNVPATGWMLVDLDSGDVLAANNARAQLMPASTLKLLTALTMSPRLPKDDQLYTASAAAVNVDGTRVGLVQGSVYRVIDLLNGLLMSSGNDTAVALSELGGGDAKTSTLMMATAAALGASDTRAVNTSGLDGAGQVTSARDLALYGRAVLADPRLAPIVARAQYDFPAAGTDLRPGYRAVFPIYNHNKMIGRYPGTLGLKTGFTLAARGSFVGAAERDGRRLECTMLHSEGQESDFCIKLLDWAFRQSAPSTPVTTLAASVAASAPPQTAVVTTPATTSASARADAVTPPASDAGWPWWLKLAVVFAVLAVAAGLLAFLLGRRADPVSRDGPAAPE